MAAIITLTLEAWGKVQVRRRLALSVPRKIVLIFVAMLYGPSYGLGRPQWGTSVYQAGL